MIITFQKEALMLHQGTHCRSVAALFRAVAGCYWPARAALAVLITLNAALLHAWSDDPNVNQPVCVASGDKYSHQTISDGQEGIITVWIADRNVWAQRLNS